MCSVLTKTKNSVLDFLKNKLRHLMIDDVPHVKVHIKEKAWCVDAVASHPGSRANSFEQKKQKKQKKKKKTKELLKKCASQCTASPRRWGWGNHKREVVSMHGTYPIDASP